MKKIFTILLLVGLSLTGYSQSYWNFGYEISVPLGDTKDYIGRTSFQGFALEGRGFVTDNITVGGWVSWEVFVEQLEDITYSEPGFALNGSQVRYINTIPMLVTSHYYFSDIAADAPTVFVGLGIGTTRSLRRTEIGLFAVEENLWHFSLTPEAGVYIPVSIYTGLNLSARYNYSVKTNDIGYSTFSFTVGIAFMEY